MGTQKIAPKPDDLKRLENELRDRLAPVIVEMNYVYARSTYRIVLHPDGTAETIYPPETLALVEQWRQIADNIKADIKRKVKELGAAHPERRNNGRNIHM